MIRALAAAVLVAGCAFLAVGCRPSVPVLPAGDVVVIDVVEGGADECTAACARLAELDCPEAVPTPKGETCGELCRRVQAIGDGSTYSLRTSCVSGAADVNGVRRCGVSCRR